MRKITAEKRAQSQARRERVRAFAKQIAAMTDEQRTELAERFGGVVTIEGRSLSLHNQCLLVMQLSSATVVGGFAQWIKAGRCVRKGEHGAFIFVPCGKKDKSGNIKINTEPDERKFIMQPVFDVSQTIELKGREAAAHKMAADVRRGVDGEKPTTKAGHTDGEFEILAA